MDEFNDSPEEMEKFSETLSFIDFFKTIKSRPEENNVEYEILYFEFKEKSKQKHHDYNFIFDNQTQHGFCFRISKPLFISNIFDIFGEVQVKGGILFKKEEKRNVPEQISSQKLEEDFKKKR